MNERPGRVMFKNGDVDILLQKCQTFVYTIKSNDPIEVEREKELIRRSSVGKMTIENGNVIIVLEVESFE